MSSVFDENLDEKVKPTKMKDVVGQPHVTRRMDKIITSGRMPHLLFSGPPGVGKTSTVQALAHELFGDNWHYNLHVFNASKNRGIDFVRNDIVNLTQISPIGSAFQIIFLDECDAFTSDAQTALREVMQAHTGTTKFILGCNYINNIIEPIQDRCRIFRFKRLNPEDIERRLIDIAKQEVIDITPEAIKYIAEHSKGSLRSALAHLETFAYDGTQITINIVKEDLQFVNDDDAKFLLHSAFRGEIEKYEERLFALYYDGGFTSEEILDKMVAEVDSIGLPTDKRKNLIWKMGEYNWRISQGSNELLQMRCFLREIEGMV